MIKNIVLPLEVDSNIHIAISSLVSQINEHLSINQKGRKVFSFITNGTNQIVLDNSIDYRKRLINCSSNVVQSATPENFIIGGSSENSIRSSPSFDSVFYSNDGASSGFVNNFGYIDASATGRIAIWANDITGALTISQLVASGNNHGVVSLIEFSDILHN